MNRKKASKIFLWIGLSLFVFSIILILIEINKSYNTISKDFSNDPIRQSEEFFWVLFVVGLFIVPIFAEELSCIRSVYKLLNCGQKGFVKTCYIISASLSLFAIVFHWLIIVGRINFDNIENGQNIMTTTLLLTQWPVIIVSFVLGSIRGKTKQDTGSADAF